MTSTCKKHLESIPEENKNRLGKKIDSDNGGTELHLCRIAESMVNWEEKLAARLELTHPEVVAIKSDNRGRSELQRREALRKWRNKKGPDATYGALLEIFVAAEENDCAEVLCSILREEDHDATAVQKKSKDTKIERFPYLNSPNLTNDERKDLEARLILKTRRIMNAFGSIVTRTFIELERQDKNVGHLRVLLQNCGMENGNKLLKKLSKVSNLEKAFEKLRSYWSFFDYELLTYIICNLCPSLKKELDDYTEEFKAYCQCRICEVPVDSYGRKLSREETAKNLHVKVDKVFMTGIENIKVQSIKEFELRLAELLATNLHLLNVKKGCIELTFGTLHELEAIFPLTLEQEKKLCQMGVTRLYSKDQDYYYNKSLLHSEGEDHDFPVITKSHALDSFTQTEKGSQTDVLQSRDLTDSCDGNKNTLGGLIVNTAFSSIGSGGLTDPSSDHPLSSRKGVHVTGTLKFVHLPTNTIKEVEVEGVAGGIIDEETISNTFSVLRFSADEDSFLSRENYGLFKDYTYDNPKEYKVVSNRLKALSQQVYDWVVEDKEIEVADGRVIDEAIREERETERKKREREGEGGGVGAEGEAEPLSSFRYGGIKSHLLEVLGNFFTREMLLKCSPVKLLINFIVFTKYCFNFCKRLLSRAKEFLTFLPGFDIICQVTSFFFQHLASIGWKSIIADAGGWAQLFGTLNRQFMSYLGVGVVSAAVGMLVLKYVVSLL